MRITITQPVHDVPLATAKIKLPVYKNKRSEIRVKWRPVSWWLFEADKVMRNRGAMRLTPWRMELFDESSYTVEVMLDQPERPDQ